jgi:predicted nucleic acid-binding protein
VAAIKAGGDLSYADAFCIATALAAEAPFWTGDPEIIERPAIIRASSSTFGLDAPVEAPIT